MVEISPLHRRMIENMTVRNLLPATAIARQRRIEVQPAFWPLPLDRLGLEEVHALNGSSGRDRDLMPRGKGPLRHALSAASEDSTHVLMLRSAEAMAVSWPRRPPAAATRPRHTCAHARYERFVAGGAWPAGVVKSEPIVVLEVHW